MSAASRSVPKPLRPRGAARVIAEHAPDGSLDAHDADLVCRPDGWYWLADDGASAFGPFASAVEARGDRDRFSDEAPSEGETLQEAEQELGVADWIDPDTGAPAEGLSTPHLAPE